MNPFRLLRQLAGSLGQAVSIAVMIIGGLLFLAMILFFLLFMAFIVGILLYLPLWKKKNKGLALAGIPIILWGGVLTVFGSTNEQFPWVGSVTLGVGLVMYILGFKQATKASQTSAVGQQVVVVVPAPSRSPEGKETRSIDQASVRH